MIMRTFLTAVAALFAAKATAQSSTCIPILSELQICLTDRSWIALETDAGLGVQFAHADTGGISRLLPSDDDGYNTIARYEEGVGALSDLVFVSDDAGPVMQVITFRMTSTVDGIKSPAVISWVGSWNEGFIIETVFPNKFNLPAAATMSDAQLAAHLSLAKAVSTQ